jgi:CHAT domain-containing protein/tetratricopeptide (TPR) repeat protein
MNFSDAADKLLNHPDAVSAIVALFTEPQLADFVTYLKEQVDAHWWSDAKLSLRYADAIIAIGECSRNQRHHALGLMARGDTLRFLGELVSAWDTLMQAADMFTAAGDEVGWARTCIGRLALCTDLHHVDETLMQVAKARGIFLSHNETDLFVRIESSVAFVYLLQGRYRDALDIMFPLIELAESLGETGKPRLRHLYQNAAYALMFLTRFGESKQYYELAEQIFEGAGDIKGVALVKLNLAYLDEKQGLYRSALQNHLVAMDILTTKDAHLWALSAQSAVRCYLALNRYDEAYTLIMDVLTVFRKENSSSFIASSLEILATIQAHSNMLEAAIRSLYEASDLYTAQGAFERLPFIELSLAEALYSHHLMDEAFILANKVATHFSKDNFLYYCNALLIVGKIYHAKGDWLRAEKTAQVIETISRKYSFSPLRYQAHLLQGKTAQKIGNTHRAIRHYQAANATINRLQQRLTMSLRSDFLLDKSDTFRNLITLLIEENRVDDAFQEIERYKSQVFWHYLLSQDNFRWKTDSPEMRELVGKLGQLRAAHHWYYHLLTHPEERGKSGLNDSELRNEVAQHESRIRYVTEQLAVHSETSTPTHFAQLPDFKAIKAKLADDTLLIEYYVVDQELYIFTLYRGTLRVCVSPTPISIIRRLIEQFQFNVDSALKVGRASPLCQQLSLITDTILNQLYEALLTPIANQIYTAENLIMVPFGVLHYVPFHLLRSPVGYQFETHPVSCLPSSSFLIRENHLNEGDSLVLGYSRSSALADVPAEAQQVHTIIGGRLALGEKVTRSQLTDNSGLILHIAAHGEFRIDQPDLSFIELYDGQLMADDLLQLDVNYSLVTLSACETGRAYVASADELIGLGRGFLYSGAASLLTSLWRTEDELTKHVMFSFYTHLCSGMNKAQALQQAYQTIYQQQHHVAFWGAFQLIGDTSPLFV